MPDTHRPVAGQKTRGAWFFPRAGRKHDTPGLQRLDAARRRHEQRAILPEFHHGMTGADIDTRILRLPLQALRIGRAEIDASEFTHAEGRMQAMPGCATKGRLTLEDHHAGDTARFQLQRRRHTCRAAADHDDIRTHRSPPS